MSDRCSSSSGHWYGRQAIHVQLAARCADGTGLEAYGILLSLHHLFPQVWYTERNVTRIIRVADNHQSGLTGMHCSDTDTDTPQQCTHKRSSPYRSHWLKGDRYTHRHGCTHMRVCMRRHNRGYMYHNACNVVVGWCEQALHKTHAVSAI